MSPIRLLLADDHRLFRQGLRELIERKTPFEVVGEATSGVETLELVREHLPDVVLLDIQMPEMDGVAVARRLADEYPEVRTIILTMYRQDRHLFEAIRAGVRGYLLKDADAEELLDVISRVHAGESVIDPTLTSRVFDAVRQPDLIESGMIEPLTERELEILAQLALGHDNRTIARVLHLSEKTIGNRLSEIFARLGVSNRTQAALIAVQRGLIPAPTWDDFE